MTQRYYAVKRPVYFRRRRFPKKFVIWCSVTIAFLYGGVYAVLFSGFFAIDRIELQGAVKTSSEALQTIVTRHLGQTILGYVPRNNLFLVSPRELQEKIRIEFPMLASVTVALKPLHRLQVTVQERSYAGVWCTASDSATDGSRSATSVLPRLALRACYLIDPEGIAYSKAAESSGILQLQIAAVRETHPGLGSQVVSPTVLDFLRNAKGALEKRFGIRTATFEIRNLPDASSDTTDGWKILLDVSGALDNQLDALEKALKNINRDANRIDYIDLRTEGRAYYKIEPKTAE